MWGYGVAPMPKPLIDARQRPNARAAYVQAEAAPDPAQ
jgi:hypothetical protein